MIPHSRYIAVASLALAGALHAAIVVLPASEPERIAIVGGGGAASISTLGDSFADMAEGASVPQPEGTTAVDPAQTPAPPPETTVSETPAPTPALPPRAVDAAVPRSQKASPPETPTKASKAKPATSTVPEARTMAALTPLQESVAPAPDSAQPVEQSLAPSPDPVDHVMAETGTPAPERSLRPQARPDRPKPKRATTSTPKQSGNANRSARAGDASGRENAQQQRAGSSQSAATQAGNAAAANYPGQVMRRIQRTRRERVNARGSAQVSFTIAANGALAAVGIARSSGSARLDQVALQQIRRAAPFPPPPAGARRSFTLRIDGK